MLVRMAYLESSGRQTIAASTSEKVSLTGFVRGVGANFGLFSNTLKKKAPSHTVLPPEELVTMFFNNGPFHQTRTVVSLVFLISRG